MSARYNRLRCVLLAAGLSRRSGSVNKLLTPIEGVPMVRRVAMSLLESGLRNVVVVLGHEADRVKACFGGLEVETVLNPNFEDGMGSSIAAGMNSVDEFAYDGILVCLADLPWLDSNTVAAVCDAFVNHDAQHVVVPEFKGVRGHPVAFPVRMLSSLRGLKGDAGAKRLIVAEADRIELSVSNSGCIRDLDKVN